MENLLLDQAVEQLLLHTPVITDVEYVPVLDAVGRILAEDLCADMDNPPFDRSPVDGYACKAEDTVGASQEHPVSLKVFCEINAGDYKEVTIQNGEAVRIMTGAAIPDGCDCCIYQEKTDYGEENVKIYVSMNQWQNYCFRGEDFRKGTVLVAKNRKITYVEAGIAASMGMTEVPVYRLPKVSLLTTGDEVVEPGTPLPPGKVYNSNQTLLAVRMKEFGVDLVRVETINDDPESVALALQTAAKDSDLIVTTGGVSVGKKDILHEATALSGCDRIFWRIILKPGMPTLFSVLNGVPVVSLSGNPFGVLVTQEVLLRPMLHKMKQDHTLSIRREKAVLTDPYDKYNKTLRMVRAIYENGKVSLPDGLHSNGVIASMSGCNCFLEIPSDTPALQEGSEVSVLLL